MPEANALPSIDLIIPTIRSEKELTNRIRTIRKYSSMIGNIIVTGFKVSASINRNYGLDRAKTNLVFMVDDDITGFPRDWDKMMYETFTHFRDVAMVSARLMQPDGITPGTMVGEMYDLSTDIVVVPQKQLPTACILIKRLGTRFDEHFIGSGFEDNDYCLQMYSKNCNSLFIIDNRVKVIHSNEKKNQGGKYWEYNKQYLTSKWRVKKS